MRNTIASHTITATKRPAGLQSGKYIELEIGGKRKEGQIPHSHSGRVKVEVKLYKLNLQTLAT